MTYARWGMAATAATLLLTITSCGASTEDNGKEYAKHLLNGDREAAFALMTEDNQDYSENLSNIDILGNGRMVDCEVGEATTEEEDGETVTSVRLSCADDNNFLLALELEGEDQLIDNTWYTRLD